MTNGFDADSSTSFLTASILEPEGLPYLASGSLIRRKVKTVEWRKKVDATIEDIVGALVLRVRAGLTSATINYVKPSRFHRACWVIIFLNFYPLNMF